MPAHNQSRMPLDAESLAELVFLMLVIWLIAGPISGFVLNTQTWVSSVFVKGAYQVESTKNLAKQLLESSERIRSLQAKLAQDELEITRLKQQSRDTNKLRALLGLKEKSPRETIAAEVIARNPDNWFEQVVIDRGKLSHITKGSAVITRDGVVGQVVSVSDNASVVRLMTDPEQKLGVVIQRIGLTGILSGAYGKPAKIDYVPVGTNVDVGDKIVCLPKGGVWPENHPVGTICAVRRDGGGASLQIEVKLSENCYDLSQVLVVPPVN